MHKIKSLGLDKNGGYNWIWAEHFVALNMQHKFSSIIVFVWSQYDGANIEQWTKGYGWRQNQEAKLKNVGGAISWSNQQLYNIWIVL